MADVYKILRFAWTFAKAADDPNLGSLISTLWDGSPPGGTSNVPQQVQQEHVTVEGKPADAIAPVPGYQSKPKAHVPGWNESYEMIDKLPPLSGSAAERVTEAAKVLASHQEIHGTCCWDWINKVYYYADATVRRVYQDLDYTGNDCGVHHAPENVLEQIGPGDWLYVNNKNKLDTHGNHSVVVVQKLGPTMIQAASCLKAGGPGRLHNIDLLKQPVTHISKPVNK